MKEILLDDLDIDLRRIGSIASRGNYGVYLVGGPVRDLLLGERDFDIDLVVEGDAIELARELKEEMGGTISEHRTFNTAVWVDENAHSIDLAGARREYYERPAALPTVEPGSIQEDLRRRDFTINAMAVSINPEGFGRLLDYFDGIRDLDERLVRILHDLSFVEDPTRILRAVRFEQKYGFRIEPHTENLAREAVQEGLVEHLTGPRIKNELEYILDEESSTQSLIRLDELGVLENISPEMSVDSDTEKRLRSVDDRYRLFTDMLLASNKKPEKWMVSLLALTSSMNEEELRHLATELQLKKRESDVLTERRQAALAEGRLESRETLKRSEIFDLLRGLALERVAFMWICGTDMVSTRISLYLKELRQVKPDLNGQDILDMGVEPSPLVGEILKRLRRARLDGLVHSRDDEIELALNMIDEEKGTSNPTGRTGQ